MPKKSRKPKNSAAPSREQLLAFIQERGGRVSKREIVRTFRLDAAGRLAALTPTDLEHAAQRIAGTDVIAEQSLVNFGLPAPTGDLKGLAPAELARRVHELGLPDELTKGPGAGPQAGWASRSCS